MSPFMKQFVVTLFVLFVHYCGFAQKLSYEVSFPNIVHHEGQVELTVTDATQKMLTFRMSRSSPGRYATHEFGKNVYDFRAFDVTGKSLPVNRIDGDVYQVENKEAYTRIRYTLYANHPDGTYAGIDPNGIHLNIPASFIWVKELEKSPIEVKFTLPEQNNWAIATQLFATKDADVFTAPDLLYFMDSPVKIGSLAIKEWVFPDSPHKFRLALEAKENDAVISAFADKIKVMTAETKTVFGEFPSFEGGRYTFLASINPYVNGDGMEHRNSTVIHLPTVFDGSAHLLGVFSHEFFHAWNVERIRPKSLEPFNYEKSNMSSALWLAEGFTQYYGDLILERAGFVSPEIYCGTIASLINTKENTAGARRISPVEASCMAVFVDAGVSVDQTNYSNTYTSYYPYGAAIALALDLELRDKNSTLDKFMQALWVKHGKTEIPYTIPDLEKVLASVTFAENFFTRYVYGHQSFDYGPLLQKAGMSIKKQFPGKAWLGDMRWKDGSTRISANTIADTPLYEAGLDINDQIVTLDGQEVVTAASITDILNRHKPGDQISILFRHREEVKSGMVTLSENPRFTVELNEKLNLPVSSEMLKFRKLWLDSKVGAVK